MREARQKLDSATSKNLKKLEEKLRELFQLDRGDLDFGLYLIMKMKSEEVCKFLREELLPDVKTVIAKIHEERRIELEEELEHTIEQLISRGTITPSVQEKNTRVKELRGRMADLLSDTSAEAEVYDHLTKFFERYYSEGDFMSQRRYTSGANSAYLIPYDGEEVKLHWANADQYYIKTTKNYASYVFAPDGDARRVRFAIAKADNEKDNIKEVNGKQRRFVLAGKSALQDKEAVAVEDGRLVIRFEHRPLNEKEKSKWPGNGNHQQARINKAIEKKIVKWKNLDAKWLAPLATVPTDADNDCTVLAKHLARYTAENSFDYFIHKDLGGFLRRELSLYLATETLNLEDLAEGDFARLHRAHVRTRAIRQVADKIITFLAQLEDYQKALWLKKKFVLETQYCVTLDKVPESLYADIIASDAQRTEWVALFAIDETNGDLATSGYSEPLTAKFLKENPFLVLDTRHFDCAFTNKLLAALSERGGLDEQLDGLLVHGENFQALNLLRARYQGQVKCVYIDPPYNTAASEIIYKNGYKHSSWISLMSNRISSGKKLLRKDGFHIATIDYAEFYNLGIILDEIFGSESRVGIVTVFINPKGRQHERFFSSSTEYMIFHANDVGNARFNKITVDAAKKEEFSLEDDNGSYRLDEFARIRTSTTRKEKPDAFYPIFVSPDLAELTLEHVEGYHKVLPTNEKGEEFSWKVIQKTFQENNECGEYVAQYNEDNVLTIYNKFYEQQVFQNIWKEKKYFPEFHGHNLLKKILGDGLFSYPKSVHAVSDALKISVENNSVILDHFAGSGTTGHAVINLNREDGGTRKYILVEIGHHFDDVLLPRIKKVVYSKDWKDGKPRGREGVSQFVKYIRLESYEDTLDNLEVTPPSAGQQEALAESQELATDYQLRYALSAETAQSASLLGKEFNDPYHYQLSIVQDGVRHAKNVDLVETFNFLLGLRISTRRMLDGVLAITGTDARDRVYLILWRDSAKMSDEKLNDWLTSNCARFLKKLDMVYVNGDCALNSANRPGETWVAQAIEPVFRELMFGGKNDA